MFKAIKTFATSPFGAVFLGTLGAKAVSTGAGAGYNALNDWRANAPQRAAEKQAKQAATASAPAAPVAATANG